MQSVQYRSQLTTCFTDIFILLLDIIESLQNSAEISIETLLILLGHRIIYCSGVLMTVCPPVVCVLTVPCPFVIWNHSADINHTTIYQNLVMDGVDMFSVF